MKWYGLFALFVIGHWLSAPAIGRAAEPVPLDSQTQIFVDDQLVALKSGVTRRVHACQKLPAPVLVPEEPWESKGIDQRVYIYGTVLYDPATKQFRMWYNRGAKLLFATSNDGINWERPKLGLVNFAGSTDNNLLPISINMPSLVFDEHETDPAKRYKMFGYLPGEQCGYRVAYSADGLRWQLYAKNPVFTGNDTCTLAQDPKTGEYLAFHKLHRSLRGHSRRLVFLATSRDMQDWSESRLVMAPDEIDDRQTQAEGGRFSQFYDMSAFPYAGQWLGLVTHFRYTGPPKQRGPGQSGCDGPIDVQLVHSRDGRTWHRLADRSPVIPNGPYDYDAGCILGMANAPVVVDDELWLYYTAINTTHGGFLPEKKITIALAKWRLDGLVSLEAKAEPGVVETVSLLPVGNRLIINADASGGRIAVEVLDAEGKPIPGYTQEDCVAVDGDSVRHRIQWKQHSLLPAGRPVRLRFHLQDANLYGYRIESGAEGGQ